MKGNFMPIKNNAKAKYQNSSQNSKGIFCIVLMEPYELSYGE